MDSIVEGKTDAAKPSGPPRLNKEKRTAAAAFKSHPHQVTTMCVVGYSIGVDIVHHPEVRCVAYGARACTEGPHRVAHRRKRGW